MPANLAEICAQCEAANERIVNGLLQEFKELQAENERLTRIIGEWTTQMREEEHPEDTQPELFEKLLELIRPDVERLELIKTEDPRLMQIPVVFREIEGRGKNE
jgi:regulator of replication initiation timing